MQITSLLWLRLAGAGVLAGESPCSTLQVGTRIFYNYVVYHRRRIKTEEKAKVVAAVWGTELIQFLTIILQQDDLKMRVNRILAAKWYVPQPTATTFAFSSVFNLLLCSISDFTGYNPSKLLLISIPSSCFCIKRMYIHWI